MLRVWRGSDDEAGTAQLLKSFGSILAASVDVVGGAKLRGKVLLVGTTRKCDGSVTHLASVLDRKVAKTTETLNCNDLASSDVHLADTVVHGDARAHERSHLDGITISGQANGCFGLEKAVLSVCSLSASGERKEVARQMKDERSRSILIEHELKTAVLQLTSTVTAHAVDLGAIAHLEQALVALTASAIMAAVPGAADAVSVLPFGDVRANLDNLADDLVAWNAGERSEGLGLDECITVAYTTSFDLSKSGFDVSFDSI